MNSSLNLRNEKEEKRVLTANNNIIPNTDLSDLKQIQIFFNISHDIMAIMDKAGQFEKFNPRFVDVLGYFKEEVFLKNFIDFVHPDDLKITLEELEKSNKSGSPVHFINRYKAKSGNYRILDWVVVPDKEHNLNYLTARDITDYKEEELNLIHSSKIYTIGEMVNGLSYMVNGQLSTIGGILSFLNDQISSQSVNLDEFKDRIQKIEEAIKRLSRVTKELDKFSKGNANEPLIETSLSNLIDNATELCKECFRIHNVKLEIDIQKDLMIKCYESQITHALVAILNHSYHAVHKLRDSWVKLEAFSKDNKIQIEITDNRIKTDSIDDTKISAHQLVIEKNFGKLSYDKNAVNHKLIIEFPDAKKIH